MSVLVECDHASRVGVTYGKDECQTRVSEVVCPSGHPLKFGPILEERICDSCECFVARGLLGHHCDLCDYDLCELCVRDPQFSHPRTDNTDADSSVMAAIRKGDMVALDTLLKTEFADSCRPFCLSDGTPLLCATAAILTEISGFVVSTLSRSVPILLERRAHPDARQEPMQETALQIAVRAGNVTRKTETPNFHLRRWSQLRFLKLLLSAGADPNASDAWGEGPLAEAVCLGDKDACLILLAYGAMPFSYNIRGQCALDLVSSDSDHDATLRAILIEGEAARLETQGDSHFGAQEAKLAETLFEEALKYRPGSEALRRKRKKAFDMHQRQQVQILEDALWNTRVFETEEVWEGHHATICRMMESLERDEVTSSWGRRVRFAQVRVLLCRSPDVPSRVTQEQRVARAAEQAYCLLSESPADADGWCCRAECMLKMNSRRVAHEHLNRALVLEPDHAGALKLLKSLDSAEAHKLAGDVEVRLQQHDKAEEHYSAAVAADWHGMDVNFSALLLLSLCKAQLQQGAIQADEAIKRTTVVLGIAPKLTDARIFRSSLYSSLSHHQEAASDLDIVSKSPGWGPPALFRLDGGVGAIRADSIKSSHLLTERASDDRRGLKKLFLRARGSRTIHEDAPQLPDLRSL